jgi:hypothetical protein
MNSKLTVVLIMSAFILSSLAFTERASQANADPARLIAKIILPTEDALVRASVPIFGLAYGKDFKSYRVEYAEGSDPKKWITIINSSTPQKEDVNIGEIAVGNWTIQGNLATWDTGLSNYVYGEHPVDLNGIYTIRLLVLGKNGEETEDRVTVEVGRVIPAIYGGKVESKDKRVVLSVPEQAIEYPFKLFGITPVIRDDTPIPESYRLIGNIYTIRPQGERFIKDALLEMKYSEDDLRSQDEENKLAIYAYNPRTGNWDYLSTTPDIETNALKTSILSITAGIAYYAILVKIKPPSAPIIYKLYSPTPLKSITVNGEAEPNTEIEVFVNGKSQGKAASDRDTGIFSLSNVLLDDGENVIHSQIIDPFGHISSHSETVICEVTSNPPKKIEYLRFMKENFSDPASKGVRLGDKVYIELNGKDTNPDTIDATDIKLFSVSDPHGIEFRLLETDFNSGLYRGIATVSKESSSREKGIAARRHKENIEVVSMINSRKKDKILFLDLSSPLAPTISSETHPSLLQNTFENGFGFWSNRDREKGAILSLDDMAPKEGGLFLKFTNQSYRGNFSSTVVPAPFDVKAYPLVSFDYRVPEDVKINFLAKSQGKWYEIEFTDNPKRLIRLNMEKIGKIEGVIADDKWHTTQFNLYQMLKHKLDDPIIVEEMIMADWDESGYMKLEYGRNKKDAAYFIDNFKVTKSGLSDSNPEFVFTAEDDLSKNPEYSFCLDQAPGATPDTISESAANSTHYQNVPDGQWYFHVRARDEAGNWGRANHYWLRIDTKAPFVDSTIPADGAHSADYKIILHLTDGMGAGVDPETITLKINDKEYDITNPALTYNRISEKLIFNLNSAGIVFGDKEKVGVELIKAKDVCGNSIKTPVKFYFVMDYSKDTIKPNPPKMYALVSYAADNNYTSFSWDSDEPLWIKGYSFLIDRNPQTMPDDEIDSHITSKVYRDLESGVWYFHIHCQDKAGNWSAIVHRKITVDNTKDGSILMIDDFDKGGIPNNLGGQFYYFTNPGADGKCIAEYHKEKRGYSLALSYEVLGDEDYSGYWTSLEGIDLQDYNSLNLWIKEVKGNELTRIGLRDSKEAEPKVKLGDYLTGKCVDGWSEAVIPLSSFVGISDWSKMGRLSFAFENWMGTREGTIYIDNVSFTKQAVSLMIDDFNDGKDPNFISGHNSVFIDGFARIYTDYFKDHDNNNGGYCYRIEYKDVIKGKRDGTPETYCGYLAMLNDLDASDYNTLSFRIKGDSGGEKPNIYLDDGTNAEYEYIDNHVDIENYATITTSWQEVNIPLIDFVKQGIDISRLNALKIVFEWEDMEGTIYIDDIQFLTKL